MPAEFCECASKSNKRESSETDPFKVYVFGEIIQNFKKKLNVFTERNATKNEDIIEASLHMKVKKWSPTPSPPSHKGSRQTYADVFRRMYTY